MKYPAAFTPDQEAGGFVVTFRDIREAITQGDTEVEALEMAADGRLTAMDFYFEDKRQVPLPSKAKKGERFIQLPLSVAAKVLLLNEMLEQQIRPTDLALRMDTTKQEVNRPIDLRHTTKIDRISEAMNALGKQIELSVA
ncbi:type II toxin-antitoxin system HicB family antitoxin [Collimonas pratensis]|uniref:type II toxin-antitoxin system HicB family antitoxin n=1 Tax=Collimonas pratensis TaxID=279113 RepID=UPI00143DD60F|nr:type II toxin-antitoxin system HicB family antitoxin [Collimonas pratensis]NKI68201.1 type II toxin-antitoxin system HicB family antitoxin [Collimonas pratensis]